MIFTEVDGIFFRAIDPDYRAHALSGSRNAGRYSRSTQATLYLSSSREGVDAAMQAHKGDRSPTLEIVSVHVVAKRIVDLRNSSALAEIGLSIADAIAPWQELAARGAAPRSWEVRDRLVACGANGLIDPSRKAPGLWHLVLFSWNLDGAPQVHLVDET
ncbi:RES family NAD+ phosphorylase [Duganella sp. Leaf126]|uniref:RES family NAD+ phosphorylase n=1 Tax=Duganella sp. Leaf126 TaxID=1736266 RepID=UPI0009EC3C80|nr:RES family NAD+ phosphorylase [Duganella sp. Leaf126]